LAIQNNQRSSNHEFVGNGVQKRPKGRGLVKFAGKVAIGPIGQGGGDKNGGCSKIPLMGRCPVCWQIVDGDQ